MTKTERLLTEADINLCGIRGHSGATNDHVCVEITRWDQVERIRVWILDHCEPTAKFRLNKNRSRLSPVSSYGWKHVVEQDFEKNPNGHDPYVANGEFIVAALRAGFEAKADAVRYYEPINAVFRMRLKRR